MDRQKIEEVRARVSCALVLSQAGFALDVRQSSRGALKFRRGGEILIVTHQGAGWFDPLSENKGDVFSLACQIDGVTFPAALERLGALAGVQDNPMPLRAPPRRVDPKSLALRWSRRPALGQRSPTDRYLERIRRLPRRVLRLAAGAGLIRQGPYSSAWFRHDDEHGALSGWEERGPDWRGFSKGGLQIPVSFGRPTFGTHLRHRSRDRCALSRRSRTGAIGHALHQHRRGLVADDRTRHRDCGRQPDAGRGNRRRSAGRCLCRPAEASRRACRCRLPAAETAGSRLNEEWKERGDEEGLPHAARPRQG
jgi:hypothetical protein